MINKMKLSNLVIVEDQKNMVNDSPASSVDCI